MPFFLYFCIFQFINNSHIVANFLNKNWKIKIRKLGHLSEEYEIYLCEQRLGINQPKKKDL